jgi:hypothetical protein
MRRDSKVVVATIPVSELDGPIASFTQRLLSQMPDMTQENLIELEIKFDPLDRVYLILKSEEQRNKNELL